MRPTRLRFATGLASVSALFSVLFLAGCNAYLHQPTQRQVARLGEETALTSELRGLPGPKEKLVAAVYKFRDQTGQYRPSETGVSWSTAVSQGTTNILLKALEESNWFTPIERENVSNLLNERKIVRSSLTQYKSEAENLPPLLFAGVILEGGVVSYDANIITGGAGLRYFGMGGAAQYRQDRVSVYLRAVATKSGKILKTVYTSKTILSQSVDVGLFRYVRFKRLLEAETGFTSTEPSQLAVTEAIEKAVYALVIEGVRDGLWSADDKEADRMRGVLEAYEKEKLDMRETDVHQARNDMRPSRLTVQPYLSAWRYQGDIAGPLMRTGYGVSVDAYFTPHWAVQANAGVGTFAAQGGLSANMTSLEAYLLFRALPQQRLTPLLYVGGGVVGPRLGNALELPSNRFGQASAGGGLEYSFANAFGLRATVDFHAPFSDQLDNIRNGRYNDYYWRGSLGLTFRIGNANTRRKRGVLIPGNNASVAQPQEQARTRATPVSNPKPAATRTAAPTPK